jgi:hypothetical protein
MGAVDSVQRERNQWQAHGKTALKAAGKAGKAVAARRRVVYLMRCLAAIQIWMD